MSSASSITINCKDSSPVNTSYLPDELLLNCLARVSRLYYLLTLFLVSKRFRSLVASKELYKSRKLLGCTESCLYVCLVTELNPYWFILCRGTTQIPKSTLVSIPSQEYFPTYGWDVTAVGSDIYMIGGTNYNDNDNDDDNDDPSSKVFIMDCRYHTWCEAPSMRFTRQDPSASVLDGKIYVAGGVKESSHESSYWIDDNLIAPCELLKCNLLECFDPKKQKWEQVQCPSGYMREKSEYIRDKFKSLAIGGKLYLLGEHYHLQVYKPNKNTWDWLRLDMNKVITREMERTFDSFCVIDNILYGCGFWSKTLQWYDFEEGFWRVLNGVEKLPEFQNPRYVRLANYGGKLAVLWEEDVSDFWCTFGSNERYIWCAEISLERRSEQEIHGKVEWCDVVLKVAKSCYIHKCIAVTV